MGAFKTLVLEGEGWRLGVDALPFEVLDDAEARKLETVFSKEEVLEALSELNGDKAPELDGFQWPFGVSARSLF